MQLSIFFSLDVSQLHEDLDQTGNHQQNPYPGPHVFRKLIMYSLCNDDMSGDFMKLAVTAKYKILRCEYVFLERCHLLHLSRPI